MPTTPVLCRSVAFAVVLASALLVSPSAVRALDCAPGYFDNGTVCQLVDQCLAGTHDCVGIAMCRDTPGLSSEFECACPHAGYAATGTSCVNINECAPGPCGAGNDGSGPARNGCTERRLGEWTAPGYDCACVSGHRSDGAQCVLDECATAGGDCVPEATCTDPTGVPGDLSCVCPAGYAGDGRRGGTGCEDLDECSDGSPPCAPQERCVNVIGAPPLCECLDGYERDLGTSACAARCGDGLIVGDESCDDANEEGGDGCSALCDEEPGWECSASEGAPSRCVRASDAGSAPDAGSGDADHLDAGSADAGLLDGGGLRDGGPPATSAEGGVPDATAADGGAPSPDGGAASAPSNGCGCAAPARTRATSMGMAWILSMALGWCARRRRLGLLRSAHTRRGRDAILSRSPI